MALEKLIEGWRRLKHTGKGILDVFQENTGTFGERYNPFGNHEVYSRI